MLSASLPLCHPYQRHFLWIRQDVCRHSLSLTFTLSPRCSWNFTPVQAGFKLFVCISCQISACSIRRDVAVLIPSHCCSKSFLLGWLTGLPLRKPLSLLFSSVTLSSFCHKTPQICWWNFIGTYLPGVIDKLPFLYSSFDSPKYWEWGKLPKTPGKQCRSRNSVLQGLLVTLPNEMLECQALFCWAPFLRDSAAASMPFCWQHLCLPKRGHVFWITLEWGRKFWVTKIPIQGHS